MPSRTQSASDQAPRTAIRAAARTLIARFGWSLLSEDELVDRILAAASASPDNLEHLATTEYTIALYQACHAPPHSEPAERAYADLFHFLYRLAFNRWRESAEDVAQQALLLIYEQIDRCHEPRAFLSFAMFKLLHAAQQQRAIIPHDARLDDLDCAYAAALPDGEPAALAHEQIDMLIGAISRLPDQHKRDVIVLRFFGALSDEEIGRQLRITANNVRVQRFHALRRLRDDPTLRQYFEASLQPAEPRAESAEC